MSAELLEKTQCTHCGEPCDEELISSGDNHFCCHGCQTVFELLSESGLNSYYSLDKETPGISMRKVKQSSEFAHLDDPTVSSKLLDFTDGTQARVTLRLPQIHCSSCIYLLENLHKLESGVKQVEVFFDRREASIHFSIDTLPLSGLAALLSRIGYEPDLSLDHLSEKKQKQNNKPLLLKIGIAGFAFGNIMLFSLPEYLAGPGGIDKQFLTLFGGLNIILALPVFFYSSLDFYKPAITSIRQRQWSMDIAISLGIIAMFFRSLYEILSGYGVGYMDSFTMLVFFLLVGRLFQQKTYDSLSFDRDFKAYFPLSVIRLTSSGGEESVAATRIETDDKIVIRNGELVPADSLLLDEEAWLDYSFVTGESEPVKVTKGQLVYAGGRNVKTSALFKTVKPVSSSYLTRLWNSETFRKPKAEGLYSTSARFSRYFSPTILAVATLSALYWLPNEPGLAINAFTAVLIIACPCAIALSAPFTLGWATKIMGKNKIYLKNAEVTEQFAVVDSVVFDKTGTLTHRDQSDVTFRGRNLDQDEIRLLISSLHENTHPLGRAIYHHLKKDLNAPLQQYLLRADSYTEESGKGTEAVISGQRVRVGSAKWVGAEAEAQDDTSGRSSRVFISFDDIIPGYFELANRYRSGMNELVSNLRGSVQDKVYLLSGDNDREKATLTPVFGSEQNLRFHQTPHDKLAFIEQLRDGKAEVLMIGDGLNDAGALRSSTVGISLAEDTSSFTPASDVIMEAGSLPLLDRVLNFSKKSITIIYISFGISILYNIIGLSYAVTGTLSPLICAIIMPVSSISVIFFTTFATHWAAWKNGLQT
ncbi:MAG: heavy metal translocating P-type ATPase metal-binding domain-containing protein [Balneolia bacterium]|nr:heavy metal translocating P-type ATPase metal-binding domain-containing protein [Balneolia bacterium]